jgi:quinol monooxygenase YgiN
MVHGRMGPMAYGYIGSMRVRDGHREAVVDTLVSGAERLRAIGCQVYAVCTADDDENVVWVTEVWDSKEQHDASLQLPETQAAIATVMPLLTGEFTRQELAVAGGLGVH